MIYDFLVKIINIRGRKRETVNEPFQIYIYIYIEYIYLINGVKYKKFRYRKGSIKFLGYKVLL